MNGLVRFLGMRLELNAAMLSILVTTVARYRVSWGDYSEWMEACVAMVSGLAAPGQRVRHTEEEESLLPLVCR